MKLRFVLIISAAAACSGLLNAAGVAAGAQVPVAARTNSGGTWGTAEEVPGIGPLNEDGTAELSSVSCASADNCSAGGYYTDNSGDAQAFVVDEVNGTWGGAAEAPGTAALNQGGDAETVSVSCASAGNCTAGGFYTDSSFGFQAFVAAEVNGVWNQAEEVPGTGRLNVGPELGGLDSVSCASAGNCSAAGSYSGSRGRLQVWVDTETNGVWGTAKEIPGFTSFNAGGALLNSLSCGSAGNCSAGGSYTDSAGHSQAFVVSQVKGTWGKAKEVPGTAALNTGGDGQILALSCASAGNCSAGGDYTAKPASREVFIVNETNGVWARAKEVPGIGALNRLGDAEIKSLSCASPGNCSAVGFYLHSAANDQAFVVNETNGVWGKAGEVPGSGALNTRRDALATAVSCASPGNCSLGGVYNYTRSGAQVFVDTETSGVWGRAEEVPGMATLNQGNNAWLFTLSCGTAGNCSAGGYYNDSTGQQAFVVSQS